MSRKNRCERRNKKKKKSYLKVILITVVIVIMIALIAYFQGFMVKKEPDWVIVESENGEIKINYSKIDDGNLHYFKLKDSDSENGFFVLKHPDGQIITRISICTPCAGESFALKNDGKEISCDKCGTKWKTDDFKGISGGCVDDPPPMLEHHEDSGYIVIKESDL